MYFNRTCVVCLSWWKVWFLGVGAGAIRRRRWAPDIEDILGMRVLEVGELQPVQSLVMNREQSDVPQGNCYMMKNKDKKKKENSVVWAVIWAVIRAVI